jgi:hypothetical protein
MLAHGLPPVPRTLSFGMGFGLEGVRLLLGGAGPLSLHFLRANRTNRANPQTRGSIYARTRAPNLFPGPVLSGWVSEGVRVLLSGAGQLLAVRTAFANPSY